MDFIDRLKAEITGKDFIDKLKAELVDIIEWLDDSENILVKRFERYANEIKYGAKLIVREGQQAVFINEGQIADVFKPGTHTLTTKNLPILATLKGWKYGFESPFKAEVYFCSTRQFTNLKWGTPGPVTMRDREFGAVRVTSYGIYAIRISNPAVFIKEIVGTDGNFTTESIAENLSGKIATRIKEVLPEAGIPVIDLESRVMSLGQILRERISPSFNDFGLDLTEVQVQDIGLPQELEAAIDKGGAMKAIGNLDAYTRYETASAINTAAANPGGIASAGVGIGMGFSMAEQMARKADAMTQDTGQAGGPPPLPVIYAAIDGKQAGPFGLDIVKQKVDVGEITKDTLVWMVGMRDWAAAGGLPELASIFSGSPPPLPKQ